MAHSDSDTNVTVNNNESDCSIFLDDGAVDDDYWSDSEESGPKLGGSGGTVLSQRSTDAAWSGANFARGIGAARSGNVLAPLPKSSDCEESGPKHGGKGGTVLRSQKSMGAAWSGATSASGIGAARSGTALAPLLKSDDEEDDRDSSDGEESGPKLGGTNGTVLSQKFMGAARSGAASGPKLGGTNGTVLRSQPFMGAAWSGAASVAKHGGTGTVLPFQRFMGAARSGIADLAPLSEANDEEDEDDKELSDDEGLEEENGGADFSFTSSLSLLADGLEEEEDGEDFGDDKESEEECGGVWTVLQATMDAQPRSAPSAMASLSEVDGEKNEIVSTLVLSEATNAARPIEDQAPSNLALSLEGDGVNYPDPDFKLHPNISIRRKTKYRRN